MYFITHKRPTDSDLHHGNSLQGYSADSFSYTLLDTLEEAGVPTTFYVTHYLRIDYTKEDACLPRVTEALLDSGWDFTHSSELHFVEAPNSYTGDTHLVHVLIHRFDFFTVEGYEEELDGEEDASDDECESCDEDGA